MSAEESIPSLDGGSTHVYIISSFVRALISAFKARCELVPADELNRRHRLFWTDSKQVGAPVLNSFVFFDTTRLADVGMRDQDGGDES